MYKNRFCFKISSDAGMAHDGMGNNAPAYLETKFDTNKPLNSSEHKEVHESLVSTLSNQLGIEKEHLSIISEEEYDDNH